VRVQGRFDVAQYLVVDPLGARDREDRIAQPGHVVQKFATRRSCECVQMRHDRIG
jgi:hypothetical protein